MGVTAIKHFMNESGANVNVINAERGHEWDLAPDPHPQNAEIWIPWCTSQVDFDWNHYMVITTHSRTYWIWQSNEGGQDRVRYNHEGRWKPRAPGVPGHSGVNGDRMVRVLSDGSIQFERL
jgi:hypothetical protein